MIIRGASLFSRAAAFLTVLFALSACGGGGGSGSASAFFNGGVELRVTVSRDSVPVNSAQALPQPSSPFVSQISILVRSSESGSPIENASVAVSVGDPQIGGLLSEEDIFDDAARLNPQPTVNAISGANGEVTLYFVAGTSGGEVSIQVRATSDGTSESTSRTINVVGSAGPAVALEFTGPFIEAIRANRADFSLAPGETIDFQNGTYSRVVSVTVNDANGNPVATNTPIIFRLIDAPLVGYPEFGAGSFEITGSNGNPLEGNFAFNAAGGDFSARGARLADRLVLDPDPDGRSFYLAGIRTISELPPGQPDSLSIDSNGEPFGVGEDQGASVPYIIGRARAGSIQSLAFTDADGTASTLLTYPFSNLGRTAILVAQTEDFSVSRVLNTGGPVYVGSLEENGLTLTASTDILPSNVTDGSVTLCVRDGNQVPLPAAGVGFRTGDTQGASVDVGGMGASGALITGTGGCVTAVVNVQGQLPGSEPISLTFFVSSIGDEPPEQIQALVTILAPDSGNLIGSLNCAARTLGLLYLTSSGDPISDVLISGTEEDWPSGSANFVFNPPSSSGSGAGITDDDGAVSVSFTIVPPAPQANTVSVTYSATFSTGNGDATYTLSCPITVPGTDDQPDQPLVITTNAALPEATAGDSYQTLLESSGGSTSFNNNWTLVFNDGATGLSLANSGETSAVLSWANPVAGSYDILVEVNDGGQGGQTTTKTFNLLVNP